MHENPEKAAEFGMPDNGQGEKQVFRIVDSEREEVAEGFKLKNQECLIPDKKILTVFFRKLGYFLFHRMLSYILYLRNA